MHAQEHSTFREGVVTGLLSVPVVVAGYTVLHFMVYILVGALLALLTHSAMQDISLRMGVWMGLVCAFCLLAGSPTCSPWRPASACRSGRCWVAASWVSP